MDGMALLREVKTRRPDLPVMMLTAYGDDERRRRAAEFGAAEIPHKAGRLRFPERTAAPAARSNGVKGTVTFARFTCQPCEAPWAADS